MYRQKKDSNSTAWYNVIQYHEILYMPYSDSACGLVPTLSHCGNVYGPLSVSLFGDGCVCFVWGPLRTALTSQPV